MSSNYILHLGDCLEVMPGIPDGSVDFIFTDPPYPYIKREYGYWTEETWIPMMQEVVRQGRRILKPHGSMVMVLQPNSEKVGKMRLWLWRFMLWCGEYWNIVQDAYWWNYAAPPTRHVNRIFGLMRPSLKYSVWLGNPGCYRNQDEVLQPISDIKNAKYRINLETSNDLIYRNSGSGWHGRNRRIWQTALDRGGTTPFNVNAMVNTFDTDNAGANGHGAGTPLKLTDWWLRYLSKSGDTILDPFNGSGTTGVATLKLGRKYIGVEKIERYYQISQERIEKVERELKGEQLAMWAGVSV